MSFNEIISNSCMIANESSCSGVLTQVNNQANLDYLRILLLFSLLLISLILLRKNKNRKIITFLSLLLLGFIIPTCTCDFTIVQSIISLILTNNVSLHIISITILAGIIILFTFFFGRYYCGWICPLGIIQELVNKYDFLKSKKLQYLKYIILIILIPLTMNNIFIKGPTINIEKFQDNFILIFTILLLIISIFVKKPWCNYFCPFGALLGIINKFSLTHLIFNGKCNSCNNCGKVCKNNAIKNGKINLYECVSCGECIKNCPLKSLKIKKFKFKLKK